MENFWGVAGNWRGAWVDIPSGASKAGDLGRKYDAVDQVVCDTSLLDCGSAGHHHGKADVDDAAGD